jgi:hypothetical protein
MPIRGVRCRCNPRFAQGCLGFRALFGGAKAEVEEAGHWAVPAIIRAIVILTVAGLLGRALVALLTLTTRLGLGSLLVLPGRFWGTGRAIRLDRGRLLSLNVRVGV